MVCPHWPRKGGISQDRWWVEGDIGDIHYENSSELEYKLCYEELKERSRQHVWAYEQQKLSQIRKDPCEDNDNDVIN